jgi:hypothetical protein
LTRADAYDYRSGLNRIKNAFLFSLIGSILSVVPFISIIGGILGFIGYIYWILCWRSFGRTDLPSSRKYDLTWKLIIFGFIVVVVTIIGSIVIMVGQLVSIIVANPPAPGQPVNFFALPGAAGVLTNFLLGILVVLGVYALVWIYNYFSVRQLGTEISHPRLVTSGTLSVIALVGSVLSTILGIILIQSLFSSLGTGFTNAAVSPFAFGYFGFFTSGLIWFGLAGIAVLVIEIVAFYLGYSATNESLWSFNRSSYAPPPPGPYGMGPPPPPASGSSNSVPPAFCPSCGTRLLRPNSTFCTNCGARLTN